VWSDGELGLSPLYDQRRSDGEVPYQLSSMIIISPLPLTGAPLSN
jgi:hypothetical protein